MIFCAAGRFQIIQWVNLLIGWLKSSRVIISVTARGDKFFMINSGEISWPRPVNSVGNVPPFFNCVHVNVRLFFSILGFFLSGVFV